MSSISSKRGRAPWRALLLGVVLVTICTALTGTPAADAANGALRGWAAEGGVGVSGVKVDLFQANADGSRGGYLRDARTDGGGGYGFTVADGCYVITMTAPDGREFTNGSRWYQRSVCVTNGNSQHNVDGILAGGNGQDPEPEPDPNCGSPIWNLELEDHFNQNGRALGSEWQAYNSTGNAGYGLRRPAALSIWGGNLNLKASMVNGTLVSGGLSHAHTQTYGRYEFRVRTDQDWSSATSGVVLTWPQSNVHPRDGENNIYETLATPADRHEFYSFIHEPYGTVHDQDYTVHPVSANQWHTMEMEWMPDRLILRRDGQTVKTIWETGQDLIPDNPHFLAIQLDAWKHSLDQPVWMQVDYVKVWSYGGTRSC
ncbi:MAG: glycoside hydrolase family 16 protein [Actinomycetota bacterium]